MKNRSVNLIKRSMGLGVTFWVYGLLLFNPEVAESSNKNPAPSQQSKTMFQADETEKPAEQLFNEAEKLAGEKTISSQLEAIKILEKARLKWQSSGDKSQEALTLLKLSSIYQNLGANASALDRYREALTLYQNISNPAQEALTFGKIGRVYIAKLEQLKSEEFRQHTRELFVNSRLSLLLLNAVNSAPEKALEFYNRSLEIYRKLGDLSAEADLLSEMAESQYLHDSENPEILLKKALEIYQKIGDKRGEAVVLGRLAELNLVEYTNEAVGWDLFNRALTIYREIERAERGDNSDYFNALQAEAKLLSAAGNYWWLNNPEKALELSEKALKIYQEIGDKPGEAATLARIGDNYSFSENIQKQLEFYTRALNVYREVGDGVGEANILEHLGLIYFRLGELEKALSFHQLELEKLKEASQFYGELGDSETALIFEYRQPLVWFGAGKIYAKLGDDTRQAEAYEEARKTYQKWEDDEGETDFLVEIAKGYGKRGNSEKMREFFNSAVAVYQNRGNLEAEANLRRDKIAIIYFALGDAEKGFEMFDQALKIYQKIGDGAKIARTFNSIAYYYIDLEKPEKALEFYRKSLAVYREINDVDGQAHTLYTIAELYYKLGKKEEALEAFNGAVLAFESRGDTEKTVKLLLRIAADYTKLEERETALKFYIQAVPISQKLGDYKQEASILRTVGLLYYQLENPNQALETFEQVRKVYQENGDRSGEAWSIYEIGKSYTTLGDLKGALSSYREALIIYEGELDAAFQEERTLDILIRMSRIYAYLGEPETAREYCQKSLDRAENIAESKRARRSEVFREIGKLCYRVGTPEIALKSFNVYAGIYQQLGADREVVSLMRIGEDYTELGDSKRALDFFNRAKNVYQAGGFSEGEIDTLIWISRVYARAGNDRLALDYLNRGLNVSQGINNRSKQALILTEIGDRYVELKDEERGLASYNQALRIYQSLENYRKQTEVLNKIGELYQKLGKLEKALEFYRMALKNFQKYQLYDLTFISINIGKIYSELGDFRQALEFLKLAETAGEGANSSLFTEMGKVYLNLGEPEKARDFFKKSLELQKENYPEIRAENLLGLARAERERGDNDAALNRIREAIYWVEKTRAAKNSPEERLTFFASKQNYYEFYIDLLMELHQQNPSKGYDAEALNISERSKARNLLELLAEANTDIRKGVDPELVLQERSLQEQLDAVERQRVLVYNNNESTLEEKTASDQEQQYLIKKFEEVQKKIREKSPTYAALTQPEPLTLQEIQQQILDDDTLLLQYFLGEKRSFLWAVTKNTLTSYELPPKALIEQAGREFFRRVVNGERATSENLSEASQPLSEMILSPVLGQLNSRRLAIVSDGILHYIPFSALSLPASSPEKEYLPLIVNHEIVNLPSASSLSVLRRDIQSRKPAPKTIAIVADPVFSSDDSRLQTPTKIQSETWEYYNLNRSARQVDIGIWERLPGTRKEAEAILALVPESERTHAFDFDANRAIATDPELNQYKIIHFATHGLFNSVNPELSGIVLSMVDQGGNSLNGFLRFHDIFNLNFSADLVVLSACKTGLGKQVRGEGLVGLTRGFMYAGTPRVVVSLWDVDDAGTAEFMTRFYRFMFSENLSPAGALRKTKLEMQKDPQWQSPYYWAAFTLQGEWR